MGVDLNMAVKLNNLGVAFLQAFDFESAFCFIREALRLSTGGVDKEAVSTSALSKNKLTVQHHNTSNHQEEIDENTRTAFVHRSGVVMHASLTAYSSDVLVSSTVSSSILHFNLALTYHLLAMELPENGTEMLIKAKFLYRKSCHLLSSVGISVTFTGNAVVDILCMAIYNNLAQLNYELFSYKDSRQCFNKVIQLSTSITATTYKDTATAAEVNNQKSFFLVNAMILTPPKFAAAA